MIICLYCELIFYPSFYIHLINLHFASIIWWFLIKSIMFRNDTWIRQKMLIQITSYLNCFIFHFDPYVTFYDCFSICLHMFAIWFLYFFFFFKILAYCYDFLCNFYDLTLFIFNLWFVNVLYIKEKMYTLCDWLTLVFYRHFFRKIYTHKYTHIFQNCNYIFTYSFHSCRKQEYLHIDIHAYRKRVNMKKKWCHFLLFSTCKPLIRFQYNEC